MAVVLVTRYGAMRAYAPPFQKRREVGRINAVPRSSTSPLADVDGRQQAALDPRPDTVDVDRQPGRNLGRRQHRWHPTLVSSSQDHIAREKWKTPVSGPARLSRGSRRASTRIRFFFAGPERSSALPVKGRQSVSHGDGSCHNPKFLRFPVDRRVGIVSECPADVQKRVKMSPESRMVVF
jgi:hypothetical protein